MSFPMLVEANQRLSRIPVTISASCTRKKESLHFHNYTHIWYVLAGQLKHRVDDKLYIQNPGSCVIVPPFTTHQIDLTESEDTPVVVDATFQDVFLTERGYRFFSFKHRFEEYKIPIYSELTGKTKEKADKLMRNMLAEFSKRYEMSFDAIAAQIVEFLRLLCVERAENSDLTIIKERIDLIMTSISYIYKNLEKKITIDDLCSVSTMSRRMFTDNFKTITGMTVARFILALRLCKARQLLITTNKSISEIAVDCGLYDKSHLIHAFTIENGISPSKYREDSRALALAGQKEFESRWGWLFTNEQ